MDEVVDLTLYSDLPSSDGIDGSPGRPLTRKTIGTLLRPVAVHPRNVSKVPISDDTTCVSNSATAVSTCKNDIIGDYLCVSTLFIWLFL